MPNAQTAEDKIRELEKEHADAIKEAQSQPGLSDFIKISKGSRRYRSTRRRVKEDAREIFG